MKRAPKRIAAFVLPGLAVPSAALAQETTTGALAANPAYDEPYDIPETLRGAGFETADGFRRRAPAEVPLDLHLDYTIRFGAGRRLVLVADAFNLLDDRDPVSYDPGTEVLFGVPNPAFGTPRNPADAASPFETPRQVRLGARLEW